MKRLSLTFARIRAAVPLLGLITIAVSLAILTSCATAPNLRVSVGDHARDIPLDSPIEITANGAMLGKVILQRVDAPAAPVELDSRNENTARITTKLEPDAEYRLSATAEPTSKTALPWQEPPPQEISVERVFSTVHAPALAEPDQEPVAVRGKPLDLRFTEPIAQASVESPDVKTTASVLASDAKTLRLELTDPAPGASYDMRVVNRQRFALSLLEL